MREAEIKLIIKRLQSNKWSYGEIQYANGVSEEALNEFIKDNKVEVVEKKRVYKS